MHLDRIFSELQDDSLYRFHLAKTEPGGTRPLDALAASEDAWLKWQVYKGNAKERFTTEYIISFAHVAGNSSCSEAYSALLVAMRRFIESRM